MKQMAGCEYGDGHMEYLTLLTSSDVIAYVGGNVLVWSGISHSGKSELKTTWKPKYVRYCYVLIIVPVIVPYIANRHSDVLQQDNALSHCPLYREPSGGKQH